ncbi:MAG TPA: DUF2167 domain-containing protein [Moraxellaceae bacterium]|nr:DUF2167 domain-containing protein [Moraxellaceae bacterium]
MMRAVFFLMATFGLSFPLHVRANEMPSGPQFDAAAFDASLNYRTGRIVLPNGKAELNLGDSFRYLSPADTDRLLVEAWGNPKSDPTQGMIIPANVSPLEASGWGVVVEYEDSGHVSDADANDINYDELLVSMQKDTKANNEAREKAGFGSIDLVGWASKPYYDETAHRMHWAKELKFSESDGNTLNYNIRVLGREGVLVLNAISGMNQFAAIKPDLERVVRVAEFTPGNRYTEFNEATDRASEYGLAALVAGGVAAKAGWLAPILLFFKKFAVLLLLGIGWLGKKIYGFIRGEKVSA